MAQIKKNLNRSNIAKSIWLVVIVFIFSIIRGYYNASLSYGESMVQAQDILGGFAFVKNLNVWSIFLFIFLNNTVKAFFVVLLGIFFGIIPLLFVFINGEIIGLVVYVFKQKIGMEIAIAALLPHGVLELPAIAIASGYGLWLGYMFYRKIRYGTSLEIFFCHAMRKFFILVVPMLFVAAVVETFITPLIIDSLK
jgi:stage II sporulation protein M